MVPIDVLQDILVLDRAIVIHEVGHRPRGRELGAPGPPSELRAKRSSPSGEPGGGPAVGRSSGGSLYEYVSMAGAANSIIVFIVFAMAVFGVANTMLMATYERQEGVRRREGARNHTGERRPHGPVRGPRPGGGVALHRGSRSRRR